MFFMKDYTSKDYFAAFLRMSLSANAFLKPREKPLALSKIKACVKFKLEEHIENPHMFNAYGLKVFSGSQGQGKTLTGSAVFAHQILDYYPCAILVTNTRFKDRPFNAYIDYTEYSEDELKEMYSEVRDERIKAYYNSVIEDLKDDFYKLKYPEYTVEEYIKLNVFSYPFNETDDFEDFCYETQYVLRDILTNEPITQESILSGKHRKVTVQYNGTICLKYVNNGKLGVVFFIDEIQLEFLSTSRNIPFEAVVEISQQRKQRKLIIGTVQRLNRINKVLREQLHDIIACRCYFGCIQLNKLIDGETVIENSSGGFDFEVKRRYLFFHDPSYYTYYDTYAKMKRYNSEWQPRPNVLLLEEYFNEQCF